jgi:hypothetical protein
MKNLDAVRSKRKKQLLAVLISLAVLINIINISLVILTKENTAPDLSEASNTCNEDCSLEDKDGRLYSCTPPDGDGTTRDLVCNRAGRIESCANIQYCCPEAGGKWTKDLAPCLSPTPTPLPTNTPTPVSTPEPTPENIILGDYDKSGRVDIHDFVIFAKHYQALDLKADLNKDGNVDLYDFGIFRNEYLKYAEEGSSTS